MLSWSCGLIVLWSNGFMFSWYCGLMVLWSRGFMFSWFCGPIVLLSNGFMFSWSCGLMVLWSHNLMVSRIHVHKVLRATTSTTGSPASTSQRRRILHTKDKSHAPLPKAPVVILMTLKSKWEKNLHCALPLTGSLKERHSKHSDMKHGLVDHVPLYFIEAGRASSKHGRSSFPLTASLTASPRPDDERCWRVIMAAR